MIIVLIIVLDGKRYYKAYNKASQDGKCVNAFIRIILAGPPNVGKTSIRRVFTKLGLDQDSPPTLIAEIDDRMFDIVTYEIDECKTCDFRKVLNRKIIGTIESFLQHTDQSKQKQRRKIQSSNLSDDDTIQNQIQVEHASTHNMANDIQVQVSLKQDNQSIVLMDMQQSKGESLTLHNDSDTTEVYDSNDSQINKFNSRQAISSIYQQLRLELEDQSFDDALNQQFGKLFDLGGQPIYHITHRPFISANSIYILVFNITQDVHQQVMTRDGQSINLTYLELMQEWLTSIIGSNSSQDKITATINNKQSKYSLPIIILVASHGDYIDSERQRIDKFKEFEESLISYLPTYKSNIYSSRIIFNCNDKDQTEATTNHRRECCEKLHTIIKGFVGSLPFMNKDEGIPLRWYIIAAILHFSIDNDNNDAITQLNDIINIDINKIMKLSDIQKLIKACGLSDSNDELNDILLYLHDIGEIIFCQTANNDGIVITDVDWFLKIMREMIRLHDPEAENMNIISDYRNLKRTGKMSQNYIDYIFSSHNLTKEDRLIILELLENYNIVCKIESKSESDVDYFVPCYLQPLENNSISSSFYFSDKLYIGYEHEEIPYLPDGIFYCLLISCLKEWNNSKVELYHQCAKYYISNDLYYIIIKKERSHISVQYSYQDLGMHQSVLDFENVIEKSIAEKRPQELIRTKLSEIVAERIPKFKKAICQFYAKCKCQQLTPIENENNPIQQDMILCKHCKILFDSESTHDWMIYERKSLSKSTIVLKFLHGSDKINEAI